MDEETIVAGLLHDVVEDTEYTEEGLIADFGEDIALLVDGVTKLASIKFESKEERQAEDFKDVSRYVEGYKGFNYKAFGQAAQPEDYQLYDSRQDNRKVQRNT